MARRNYSVVKAAMEIGFAAIRNLLRVVPEQELSISEEQSLGIVQVLTGPACQKRLWAIRIDVAAEISQKRLFKKCFPQCEEPQEGHLVNKVYAVQSQFLS